MPRCTGLWPIAPRNHALGPDVEITVEAYDECNTLIEPKRWAKRLKAAGSGFVGLVGVQSNQYPRALDIARQFRAEDIPVVIGGFHVSGCISMLPKLPADLQAALDLGITLYAGEAESRMDELLRDIDNKRAKPIYNFLSDLPEMSGASFPLLPKHVVQKVLHGYTRFDAGRGCPFQCSFCTIINVQGRKSRFRTPDDVETVVRANLKQGHHAFLYHRRQFRPQPQLGSDPRPLDRAARERAAEDPADPAGRYALPPDPEFHREGGARRLQQRLHRAREHQSRNP